MDWWVLQFVDAASCLQNMMEKQQLRNLPPSQKLVSQGEEDFICVATGGI